MGKTEKAVLGSVRLDSDVWEAVRAMPESLNQYLRRRLLTQAGIPVEETVVIDEDAKGVFSRRVERRPLREKGDKTR